VGLLARVSLHGPPFPNMSLALADLSLAGSDTFVTTCAGDVQVVPQTDSLPNTRRAALTLFEHALRRLSPQEWLDEPHQEIDLADDRRVRGGRQDGKA
jgi:hypothetical protein